MAPGFAHSISLPLSPSHKKASYHVRSVSLPCQSHPLIGNLEEHIQVVRSWAASPEGSAAWIEAGLVHTELLHTSLNDFLQLSQTRETLRQAVSVNQLLDDLLRQDGVQMASSLRSHRHVQKQMVQLVSEFRGMTKCKHLSLSSDAKELEMVGIIVEAISATAFASMAVFTGAGALSAPASSTKMRSSFLKKRSCDVEKDIQALEKVGRDGRKNQEY